MSADHNSGRRKLYSLFYYVRNDGSPSGEVGLTQATQLMESGNLNGNTFVWADGMDEWAKLCDCKALFVLDLDDMKLHYETSTSLPSDIVTVRHVRRLLASGEITADTLVWAEGMDEWARLSECHSFFGVEKSLLVAGTTAAGNFGAEDSGLDTGDTAAAAGASQTARAEHERTPEPEPEPLMEEPPILGVHADAKIASRMKTYGTDWMCRQRVPLEKDRVISSLEFDGSGDFIAIGDTGGNVSILRRQESGKFNDVDYGPYIEFAAHEPEFDALKSAEISERVNCVRWVPNHRKGTTMLTSNDKTIKLWRVNDGATPAAAGSYQAGGKDGRLALNHTAWGEGGAEGAAASAAGGLVIPRIGSKPKLGRRAKMCRAFRNAHSYTMNSISCCSDGETFISSDDLRVYLWSLERENEVFMTLDLKPDNLEDLTEVITTSKFHPEHCYLFGYSNSRGQVKLHDLRDGALCGHHKEAKLLHDTTKIGGSDAESLFDELLVSISDISFGGRQVFVRDLMTVRVWCVINVRRRLSAFAFVPARCWCLLLPAFPSGILCLPRLRTTGRGCTHLSSTNRDIAMPREPVRVVDIAGSLRPRLGELWQSERIFDRFEVAVVRLPSSLAPCLDCSWYLVSSTIAVNAI